MAVLHTQIETLEQKLAAAETKFEELSKEHEDLLVALAEKTIELTNLKKEFGVPDDENESGDDDEDGDGNEGEEIGG